MAVCDICSKGPQFGNRRSHALNATRRLFKPNLVKKNLLIDGEKQKVTICTRCIRTLQKKGKFAIAS